MFFIKELAIILRKIQYCDKNIFQLRNFDLCRNVGCRQMTLLIDQIKYSILITQYNQKYKSIFQKIKKLQIICFICN